MDNREHWSVPEKGLQRAKKTECIGISRSHALCFISIIRLSAKGTDGVMKPFICFPLPNLFSF